MVIDGDAASPAFCSSGENVPNVATPSEDGHMTLLSFSNRHSAGGKSKFIANVSGLVTAIK